MVFEFTGTIIAIRLFPSPKRFSNRCENNLIVVAEEDSPFKFGSNFLQLKLQTNC